jgi:hypothetical protein
MSSNKCNRCGALTTNRTQKVDKIVPSPRDTRSKTKTNTSAKPEVAVVKGNAKRKVIFLKFNLWQYRYKSLTDIQNRQSTANETASNTTNKVRRSHVFVAISTRM